MLAGFFVHVNVTVNVNVWCVCCVLCIVRAARVMFVCFLLQTLPGLVRAREATVRQDYAKPAATWRQHLVDGPHHAACIVRHDPTSEQISTQISACSFNNICIRYDGKLHEEIGLRQPRL